MPRISARDRTLRLLTTARTNPEFARRVAQELPLTARQSFISELAKPETDRATALPGPGLAKCARSPFAADRGLTAQLRVVAASASRVR
jgi:hypothetical protein